MQQEAINTEIRLNTNTRPRPTGTPSNLEGEFLGNTTHSTAASGTESTCHWQLDHNLGEQL